MPVPLAPLLLVALAAVVTVGVVVQWRRRRAFRFRVRLEDALKHLHAAAERAEASSIETLAAALRTSTRRAARTARMLCARGLATSREGLELTRAGARAARRVVRAHRLWERYLADELDAPLQELHRRADREEHRLGAAAVEHLAAHLGHPEHDPHGDPIPAIDGRPSWSPGRPLTELLGGESGEIVHIEDEPEAVFARLVGSGLGLTQRVTVREPGPDRYVLDVDGDEVELSPVEAANVFVVPAPRRAGPKPRTLADLRTGEHARIRRVGIAGFARRRLFDLGFTPGVRVTCTFPAAVGDTRAYRVRDTLIAIRPDLARRIEIEPAPAVDAP